MSDLPSSDDQQSNPVNRATLIEYFSDNKVPTGDQFRQFIQSTLIKGEDNITIGSSNISIAGDGVISGSLTVNESMTFANNWLDFASGQVKLGQNELKVGSLLHLTGEGELQVNSSSYFNQGAQVKGWLSVAGADEQLPALDVSGDTVINGDLLVKKNLLLEGGLEVTGDAWLEAGMSLGSTDSSGHLSITHDEDKTLPLFPPTLLICSGSF